MVGCVLGYAYRHIVELLTTIRESLDEWEEEINVTFEPAPNQITEDIERILSLSDDELRHETEITPDNIFIGSARAIVNNGYGDEFLKRLQGIERFDKCAIVKDLMKKLK